MPFEVGRSGVAISVLCGVHIGCMQLDIWREKKREREMV